MSLKSTGRVVECLQGSREWFECRMGRVTASEVASVLAFLKRGEKKGGDRAKRSNYKTQIVSERLSGHINMDGYVSPAMMHGNDYEAVARAEYRFRSGNEVDLLGFVFHPTIEMAGSSPDGFIDDDGGLELKCPNTTTHFEYMMAGDVPEEYEPQMMFGMACTGRMWWDFCSFDPRVPERHQVFTKRLYRREERIAEIEAGVIQFLSEVDDVIERLNALNPAIFRAEPEAVTDSLGISDEELDRYIPLEFQK